MNLKARLQEHSQKRKVKWEIIKQDYVLSWALRLALPFDMISKGNKDIYKHEQPSYYLSN